MSNITLEFSIAMIWFLNYENSLSISTNDGSDGPFGLHEWFEEKFCGDEYGHPCPNGTKLLLSNVGYFYLSKQMRKLSYDLFCSAMNLVSFHVLTTFASTSMKSVIGR